MPFVNEDDCQVVNKMTLRNWFAGQIIACIADPWMVMNDHAT